MLANAEILIQADARKQMAGILRKISRSTIAGLARRSMERRLDRVNAQGSPVIEKVADGGTVNRIEILLVTVLEANDLAG